MSVGKPAPPALATPAGTPSPQALHDALPTVTNLPATPSPAHSAVPPATTLISPPPMLLPSARPSPFNLPALLFALWLLGVLGLLLQLAYGLVGLRRLAARACYAGWQEKLREAQAALGLRRPIRLLLNATITVQGQYGLALLECGARAAFTMGVVAGNAWSRRIITWHIISSLVLNLPGIP